MDKLDDLTYAQKLRDEEIQRNKQIDETISNLAYEKSIERIENLKKADLITELVLENLRIVGIQDYSGNAEIELSCKAVDLWIKIAKIIEK